MGSTELSRLCHVCTQVNFAAILTPREWDETTGGTKPIFRPEYNGSGKSPDLEFPGFGKTDRTTDQPETYLPRIRTAVYDDLSASDEEDSVEHSYFESNLGENDRGGWGGDDYDDEEGDRNSDESASTWSNNSHFMEIQRIDLDKQALGDWSYRRGQLYHLGSIWDLRSRRHDCDLCRRLWRQTRKNADVKDLFLTKSRCILKLLDLKSRRNDTSNTEIIMLNLVYIYGYKLGDPRDNEWIVRNPFVIHGMHRDVCDLYNKTTPGQLIPFDDRLFGEARVRGNECNFPLFREWLKVCETKHNHQRPKFSGSMAFRLIDVHQKCLIEWEGPVSNVPRFVALSYVWGMLQQTVMLTADQLSLFKKPGYFDHRLDKTVRDAIEAVFNLGETYLWVDALCIFQDSEQDKAYQIPQMEKIFSTAVLTIIAASGQDADSGLPGVADTYRAGNQFKLELKDIRIMFRAPTQIYVVPDVAIGFHENYLKQTKYKSRGWTFQEGHLSTRVLVFTKDQVYWECAKCTWCEETHWESEDIDFTSWRDVIDPVAADVWEDRFEQLAYDPFLPKDLRMPEPLRNSYAALVKEYSVRELRHDKDILNACMGVLSSIAEREHSDFFYGLRTRHFGNDLLFNMQKPLLRRFPDETSPESTFPTWSWASWKGQVEIANEPKNNGLDIVENIAPCDGIKCYMLDTTGSGQLILRVVNETGGWRFHQGYVRSEWSIWNQAEMGHPMPAPDYENDSNPSDNDSDSINPAQTTIPVQAPRTQTTHTNPPSQPDPNPPPHRQDLTLADIEPQPSFLHLTPNFHIIFATFSSLVLVLTESIPDPLHPFTESPLQPITNPSNNSIPTRNIYALHHSGPPSSSLLPFASPHSPPPLPLPPSLAQGALIGHIPLPARASWTTPSFLDEVPDGIYRLLWMNNNQLPMLGHLLCRPDERTGVLRRVVGAVGPADVLVPERREVYGAEWGVWVLG